MSIAIWSSGTVVIVMVDCHRWFRESIYWYILSVNKYMEMSNDLSKQYLQYSYVNCMFFCIKTLEVILMQSLIISAIK